MKLTYTAGSNQNKILEEGDHKCMIKKADVLSIKGKEKLVVTFMLENGEEHTEFILPQTWLTLFTDILDASGQVYEPEGEIDTDYFIGLEGILRIIKNEGAGEYAGRTFYNAERFIKAEKKS